MVDVVEGNTHGKSKWAILFTVLVMTFMATLDSSIVNVALPVMQKELAVGLGQIQWVSSVYLLTTCALLLVFGLFAHSTMDLFFICDSVFSASAFSTAVISTAAISTAVLSFALIHPAFPEDGTVC